MIALDFQDLQIDSHSRNRFVTDDGDHPSPYLRPEIYLNTLETMQMGKWANALGVRWGHLRDSLAPIQQTLAIHGTATINTDNASNLLKAVTDEINHILSPHQVRCRQAQSYF